MINTFIVLGLALLTLFGAEKVKNTNPLTLYIRQAAYMNSPADVMLTTKVPVDNDNRYVCVSVSGGDYEASECRDTDQAPITVEWHWRVPAGRYDAVAVLGTIHGTMQTTLKFTVGSQPEQ